MTTDGHERDVMRALLRQWQAVADGIALSALATLIARKDERGALALLTDRPADDEVRAALVAAFLSGAAEGAKDL